MSDVPGKAEIEKVTRANARDFVEIELWNRV